MERNIENHWASAEQQARIGSIIGDEKVAVEKKAGLVAHTIVIGGYTERSASDKLTGEWIVFANENEVNYYLTLGTHSEGDEAILKRVMACYDEFPELHFFHARKAASLISRVAPSRYLNLLRTRLGALLRKVNSHFPLL